MIGVIGDHDPGNATHVATSEALQSLGADFEWIATEEVRRRQHDIQRASGYLIAPASPYRDADAVLEVIRYARERGVPLVGT